ncbi:inorganic diphosphatase [Adhaeribacter rhizoryzae]|uniref:inorganic diphosphatase n=1 Tax=Adhaeribacter rhizoryzae TaxID=2607907 RepID=UPI00167FE1AD|nr:inorganic diphosphatase [Adhaeribacter rhizoryzae]
MVGLLLLASCKTDYENLPTFSAHKQLQVVILTPAGSNHPQEYDSKTKTFVSTQEAGLPAKINFLPLPGNLGFIPSTAIKHSGNNENEPLAALVLAESVPSGTVMEVIPLGTLALNIAGEARYIIIATPSRPTDQILAATDFNEFVTKYPAAKEIIQKWFLYHNPNQKTRLLGWKNDNETEDLIRRWLK